MIYTVTLNPAIDYVVEVSQLVTGEVNRTVAEEIVYGGKGINVSVLLKQLGLESVALGFIAGFTGCQIEKGVSNQGVTTKFIHLNEGTSRINVKVKALEETEINGQGPTVSAKELALLFEQIKNIQAGDVLILAGSIPATMPNDVYEKILQLLEEKEIRVIVDASGQVLLNVVKYHPFLIKPNRKELSDLFGCEIILEDDIVQYAKKLQKLGACNVLVSMDKDGAILVTETKQVFRIKAFKGTVVNSVGAGDSMVAGFVAGYEKTNDYEYALKLGAAAGSATAFSKGIADKNFIMKLLEQIT